MRLLDITYPEPTRNLALDEVILDSVEKGRTLDTLRLWESPTPFVVIGSGQRYREVVNYFNCLRDNVPVLRRCSAGGAVLQGPGCLNFALALSYNAFPEVADLHQSYRYILGQLITTFKTVGIVTEKAGVSDLVLVNRKFSGNAQRRKRNACLHHGSLVYQMDAAAMNRYLLEPRERPHYRGERNHEMFMRPIPLPADALRRVVTDTFAPSSVPERPLPEESETVETLARAKYERSDWTLRR